MVPPRFSRWNSRHHSPGMRRITVREGSWTSLRIKPLLSFLHPVFDLRLGASQVHVVTRPAVLKINAQPERVTAILVVDLRQEISPVAVRRARDKRNHAIQAKNFSVAFRLLTPFRLHKRVRLPVAASSRGMSRKGCSLPASLPESRKRWFLRNLST